MDDEIREEEQARWWQQMADDEAEDRMRYDDE